MDTHYAWTAKEGNYDLFRGYTKSVIEQTKEGWKINVYNNQQTYAQFNESRNSYLLGTKHWNVVNDACTYDVSSTGIHNEHSSRILLSLNTCEPYEFNCNDGTW